MAGFIPAIDSNAQQTVSGGGDLAINLGEEGLISVNALTAEIITPGITESIPRPKKLHTLALHGGGFTNQRGKREFGRIIRFDIGA